MRSGKTFKNNPGLGTLLRLGRNNFSPIDSTEVESFLTEVKRTLISQKIPLLAKIQHLKNR